MTGNDGFGPYPTGGGQPPAAQPQWAPPPGGGPWGPGAPPWTPTPTPKRSRGPWIAGAVVIVVVAVVVSIVVVSRQSTSVDIPTPSTAIPSSMPANATPKAPFYMLADPADALPTVDEVKASTLMELTPNGAPRTTSLPDHATNPPNCTLATSSTTQSMWGDATQLAGQQFTDPHGSGSRAWAGLAFWESDKAAQASLDRLTAAIQGCPAFTLIGVAPDPDTKWAAGDIRIGDHRIGFTTTLADGDKPWKCIQDYRVEANIAVTASMCSTNPSSSAAALSDVVMSKATKH
ncbi:sensor domain-containing protein [Mycolicibacterium sphagni]|uniref:Sensor domain-containing protein n=1 Tax=Mycolicibacterium sphagni TaxID=1786 RepID=A0ABX2JXX7_9MYCO|nr:sensor domain-containing protein [Mycolicibacterium sphagni]